MCTPSSVLLDILCNSNFVPTAACLGGVNGLFCHQKTIRLVKEIPHFGTEKNEEVMTLFVALGDKDFTGGSLTGCNFLSYSLFHILDEMH